MAKLIRKKLSETSSIYRNRGGFLPFLGQCAHPSKFEENGVDFIDINICNIGCENRTTCKNYWNRKERIKRSIELNYQTINPKKIKEELNGTKP